MYDHETLSLCAYFSRSVKRQPLK